MRTSIWRTLLLGGCWTLLAYPVLGQGPAAPAIELRYLRPTQMPCLPNGAADAASLEAALRQQLHYRPAAGSPAFGPDDIAQPCFTIGADGRVRDARVLSEQAPDFGRCWRRPSCPASPPAGKTARRWPCATPCPWA